MSESSNTAALVDEWQRLTIKLRLRDKHAAELKRQSRAVSYVWNFCNATQQKAAQSQRRWLSAYDLQKLTTGSSKELDIHSDTITRVCSAYDVARRSNKKAWLRWRSRRSLGWVPFNTSHVAFDGERFVFRGVRYETTHLSDRLKPGIKIRAGSFNADSKGRWYINLSIKVDCEASAPLSRVGIDLGLKELAALSSGEKIEAPRLFRASEAKIASAQRARKSKRARNIHAKVANRRKDFLHKASAKIAKEYGLIVIGDVSPSKMARTKMAKSTLDAGWSAFKNMLRYKSHLRAGACLEVREANTSRTCSCCGAIPLSSPKGRGALRIREWRCDDCGTVHDRDVNAAINILRVGHHALVGGAHV